MIRPEHLALLVAVTSTAWSAAAGPPDRGDDRAVDAGCERTAVTDRRDEDGDGLPAACDDCPSVHYDPGFDVRECAPMNLDPADDAAPECRARERVARYMLFDGVFINYIAFSVVREGRVHVADAFEYLGQGAWRDDPEGIHRLYRIGSTSKSVTAVTAKIMEEGGELSLDDFVDDDDGTREIDGDVSLRQLLSHRGAFTTDFGAIHLFCYPGDLATFWAEPDDAVSPHYDSATYGNLGGGYSYSAFNYGLAGAYVSHRAAASFGSALQTRLFDPAGMCTASVSGRRAVRTEIGRHWAVSQGVGIDVGPYINLVSPTDDRCEDNFYSSDDLPGDDYAYQLYHLDEADSAARDPAGGVIASVMDLAHFARELLASYDGTGTLLSPEAVRELWTATTDLGCAPSCPYEPYYGLGFFTDSLTGDVVAQCGHGGSRPGYTSAFVLRPEAGLAACVLVNADTSTVDLSDLAKAILDDFERADPSP